MEAAAKEEGPSVRTSAENPHSGAQADVLYGTPDEVASWSDMSLKIGPFSLVSSFLVKVTPHIPPAASPVRS